jgi:lipopolysaccharide/colanic/teichoic acid biosynthesis glycosyltransferase
MTPSVGSYHQRRDADAIDLMTLESTRNWDQLSLQDSYPWLKLDASERRAEPGRAYQFAKRVLDIIVSATALLLLLPVLLLVLIAVKLDHTAAPVFFTQQRTGQGGRTFRIFKFRSMRPPTEEDLLYGLQAAILEQRDEQHPKNAEAADPRITPFGHFIRRTSLDELPQLFNVLRGDMSLVGPRPTSLAARGYDLWQTERLEVKPGLTGLWQIMGRGTVSFSTRCRMDIAYARRPSLALDLKILARSVPAVLTGRGAR